MMTYPYVPAWFDRLGARKGPTLGLLFHMAEGGGTVGYLDKHGTQPPRGVSVHAVCDYKGVVTRMLAWGDASGSLNPSDRSTDKAYFGHSALVDVLGTWWKDPNSAVLSMEIEGFAKTGPNQAQAKAAIAWGLDMRAMFPSIRGAIGHADQTDTKGCPGTTALMKAIFAGVGGHGLFVAPTPVPKPTPAPTPSEDTMQSFTLLPGPSGSITLKGDDHAFYRLRDGTLHATTVVAMGAKRAIPVKLLVPIPGGSKGADRATGWLIGSEAAFVLASDVTFTPDLTVDTAAAVVAAVTPLNARLAGIKAKAAAFAADVADD